MAIFQPTNVTPSSFAGLGGGTIAARDIAKVTWQVNGNSPLTNYEINIYKRESSGLSNLIFTISSRIYWKDDEGNVVIKKPNGTALPTGGFYPTNEKGIPQFLTITALSESGESLTWADCGVEDGENYQLKITQYWGEDSANTTQYVVQYSESAFIARTMPVLTLKKDNSAWSSGSPINQVAQVLMCDYSQEQGDSINWCRWQFAEVSIINGVKKYTLIDDTGEIYTAKLEYTLDGMLSGKTYAVKCSVCTQNGVEVTTNNGEWFDFDVSYTIPQRLASLSVDSEQISNPYLPTNPKRYCNILSYSSENGGIDIQGKAVPSTGYTLINGQVKLNRGATITWDNVKISGETNPLNIPIPFSIAYEFTPEQINTDISLLFDDAEQISRIAITGDGQYIAVLWYKSMISNICTISICKVAGNEINILGQLNEFNNVQLFDTDTISTLIFSDDGKGLAVGGQGIGLYLYYTDWNSSPSTWKKTQIYSGRAYEPTFAFMGASDKFVATNGVYRATPSVLGGASLYTINYTDKSISAVATAQNYENLIYLRGYKGNKVIGIGADNNVYVYTLTNDNSATWTYTMLNLGDIKLNDYVVFSNSENSPYFLTKSNEDNPNVTFCSMTTGLIQKIGDNVSDSITPTFLVDDSGVLVGNRLYARLGRELSFYSELSDASTYGITVAVKNAVFSAVGKKMSIKRYGFQDNLTHFLDINHGIIGVGTNGNGAVQQLVSIVNNTTAKNIADISFISLVSGIESVIVILTITEGNTTLSAQLKDIREIYEFASIEITGTPVSAIESLKLTGWQITNYILIEKGAFTEQIEFGYIPTWGTKTEFLADFTADLNAGRIADIDIYRFDLTTNEYLKLCRLKSGESIVRDYGWLPYHSYYYDAYLVTTTSDDSSTSIVYSSKATTAANPICKSTSYYLLMECVPDELFSSVFHVKSLWRFGNNISVGSISNNNNPNWLQTFTGYRTKQPSGQHGRTGNLSALLSNVNGGAYSDTVEQMEALYAASLSSNAFFLKDVKGNLYMVSISAPITQTLNLKSPLVESSISIQWEEIGDTKGISLIQTRSDEGYFNILKN